MAKNTLAPPKANSLDAQLPPIGNYGPPSYGRPDSLYDRLEQLSYGLGGGLAKQVEGYGQMVSHPLQSGQDILASLQAVAQNPSLASNAMYGMWNRATSGLEGLGEVAGENINPRNLLKNLARPNVLKAYKVGDKILAKDGRRGTIVDVRRLPDRDLSAWEAKRKELSNQAFQGYLNGQHTFEQGTAIFDELLKRHEDELYRLYTKSNNRLKEVPKVLFENETRPTSVFDSEIETHFGGPVRK